MIETPQQAAQRIVDEYASAHAAGVKAAVESDPEEGRRMLEAADGPYCPACGSSPCEEVDR